MSLICDSHKFIFLHVAKTGGKSINQSLKERYGNDGAFYSSQLNRRVNVLGRMLGLEARALAEQEKWDSYFKFAFARNPWDRTVSIYEHLKTEHYRWHTLKIKGARPKSRLTSQILKRLEISIDAFSFERFLMDVIRDRAFENYHWDTLANALTDGKGNIIFDFVGRFENLQEDFDHACRKIGIPLYPLPHHNKSLRTNMESYYTPDTANVVSEFYAEDIELFRYKFDT